MLSAEELKRYAVSLSIPVSGVCDAEDDPVLLEQLKKRRQAFSFCEFEEADAALRCSFKHMMPEARSVFVCLFPYYIRSLPEGNISCYAMVQDYHRVVNEMLGQVVDYVKEKEPQASCRILCDVGPQVDRRLAYRAGLGFFGKNNLLIHPVYGSYFFIGSILMSVPFAADKPLEQSCDDCGACLASCPGQALSENFGFDSSRCISYLTQKKELSAAERGLLATQDSVYGCDVCQKVCPHNQNVPDTPIQAFYQSPVTELAEETLTTMSNREFKRVYGNYPFSWCSKKTIQKNFNL